MANPPPATQPATRRATLSGTAVDSLVGAAFMGDATAVRRVIIEGGLTGTNIDCSSELESDRSAPGPHMAHSHTVHFL